MTVIGTAVMRLLGDTAQFRQDVDKATKKWDAAGKSMRATGAKLTAGITLPLLVAGGAAVKFATSFQEGMANVASLIPGNIDRVVALGESVKNLSVETGKPLTDLTAGLYNVVSAFGDTADTAEILRTVGRAAVAGLAETADALSLVSGVTKTYGDTTAAAVQDVADLALLTVRLGETTFPALAASMGNVTPLAKELNITQEELFGTMATFTGVTGKASVVSTQFRGVLQALLAPTDSAQKLFKQLGVESGKALVEQRGLQGAVKALTDAAVSTGKPLQDYIGSIEGQTFALASAGGQSVVWGEKIAAMADKVGAVDDAFREQTEGINATGFALKQSRNEVAIAAVELGQVLLPTVVAVTKVIAKLANWFTNLSPGVKTAIVVFGGMAAALGPLLLIGGQVLIVVSSMAAAFPALGILIAAMATPVVLAVAALAALVLVGIQVINHWDVLSFEATQLWENIKAAFSGGIDWVKNLLTGFMEGVKDRFAWLANVLVGQSIVPDMMKAIGKEFGGMDKLMVAPADEAAAAVNKAFQSIANPEALKAMDFNVSINADELYAAVIAATGSAAVAFQALSEWVEPSAGAFMALYEEVTGAAIVGRSYTQTIKDLRRASLDLDHDLQTASGSATLMGQQALTVGGELLTMSAAGQAGMDQQLAALKSSELGLKLHKLATDTMAMVTDQTTMKFQNMQRAVASVIADFTPMGMLATIFGSALEALEPALKALKAPLEILGRIIGAALVPVIKALFPALKFLAIAATFVIEIFFKLAGGVLKVLGWLLKAIGTFVEGIGKMLSKIPLIGGLFKPLQKYGKAQRKAGEAMMGMADEFQDSAKDIAAGREEIRALEWPDEAVAGQEAQVAAAGEATGAAEGTTQAVQDAGNQLLEISRGIFDGLMSIRDLTVEGVGYLAQIASGPGMVGAQAVVSPQMPASIIDAVATGGGGVAVEVLPGAVIINTAGEHAEQDGRDAARGFMDEISGERFNRTRRLKTRSGRIDPGVNQR